MERLQISKYELSSLDYLNKMINGCSIVYQLRLNKLDLSTCTGPLKNIELNESIKRIIIGDTVKFSMPSLQFFVQKFRVLEEFYMDRFVGPNENEWWDQLLCLCSRLKKYYLLIVLSNFSKLNQIQKCVELSVMAAQHIKKKRLDLTMNPGLFGDYDINTHLTKETDSYSFLFDTFLFSHVDVGGILQLRSIAYV